MKQIEPKMKSLSKALEILDYFMIDRPAGTVTEISETLGFTKSNAYDILRTLEAHGYVEQNEKTKEYRLGYAVLKRSFVYNQTNDKIQQIRDYLSEAANEVGELANFATIRDYNLLYLGQCIPQNRKLLLSDYVNVIGFTAPLYCTGLGKAMLAYRDPRFVEEVIAMGFENLTPTTIVFSDQLKQELENIRIKGYAIDNAEHSYGVRCVAVPILDHCGQAQYAISFRGSPDRFTDERIESLAKSLKQCAQVIQKHVNL